MINQDSFWNGFDSNLRYEAQLRSTVIGQRIQSFIPRVEMNQVHGNTVAIVMKQYDQSPKLIDTHGHSLPENVPCDALITKDYDLALTVRTADCLPIFLRSSSAIGVIHAGREGTINGIVTHACKMIESIDSPVQEAWFGPAICIQCYEIDSKTNTHFDLIAENMNQLVTMCPDAMIRLSNACTHCSSDHFYSYRSGDISDRNYFSVAIPNIH